MIATFWWVAEIVFMAFAIAFSAIGDATYATCMLAWAIYAHLNAQPRAVAMQGGRRA